MKEKLSYILLIAALIGFPWWFFNHMAQYALCESVKQIEQKYDYKFKVIEIKGTNERIWQLEAELKKNPGNKTAAEELKKLKEEKSLMTEELKELGKKR